MSAVICGRVCVDLIVWQQRFVPGPDFVVVAFFFPGPDCVVVALFVLGLDCVVVALAKVVDDFSSEHFSSLSRSLSRASINCFNSLIRGVLTGRSDGNERGKSLLVFSG